VIVPIDPDHKAESTAAPGFCARKGVLHDRRSAGDRPEAPDGLNEHGRITMKPPQWAVVRHFYDASSSMALDTLSSSRDAIDDA
jgi:hypothetical protein